VNNAVLTKGEVTTDDYSTYQSKFAPWMGAIPALWIGAFLPLGRGKLAVAHYCDFDHAIVIQFGNDVSGERSGSGSGAR